MSQTPREVYADHAATTRPAPEVVAAMTPYLGERFGNASSVHRRGEAAREALEEARAKVAEAQAQLDAAKTAAEPKVDALTKARECGLHDVVFVIRDEDEGPTLHR